MGDPAPELADLLKGLEIQLFPVSLEHISSLSSLARRKEIQDSDYILLDLDAAHYSKGHILSTVQQLCRHSRAELLVAGTPSVELTALFLSLKNTFRLTGLFEKSGHLLQQIHDYISTGSEALLFAQDVLQAAPTTATERTAAMALRLDPARRLTIAVAGALPRCGVTTQVLAICRYFSSVGLRPAVLDPQQALLQLLLQFYDATEAEGYTDIDGVHFCAQYDPRHDIYVLDLGLLTPQQTASFAAADLRVLVMGTKPWEIQPGLQIIKQLRQMPLIKIASFTTQQQADELREVLDGIWPAPYRPDPWTADVGPLYQQMLRPWLQGLARQNELQEEIQYES